MPRTGRIKPRTIKPDSIYSNRQVAKLINIVMKGGKKRLAQSHVYTALNLIEKQSQQNPLQVFETAIKNVTPQMEVHSRRVGGAAYQVPMPVKGRRGLSLALRWLVLSARERSNQEYHTFAQKLAAELIDASQGQGGAIQRKITSHKMAEANKAFAHFRW